MRHSRPKMTADFSGYGASNSDAFQSAIPASNALPFGSAMPRRKQSDQRTNYLMKDHAV